MQEYKYYVIVKINYFIEHSIIAIALTEREAISYIEILYKYYMELSIWWADEYHELIARYRYSLEKISSDMDNKLRELNIYCLKRIYKNCFHHWQKDCICPTFGYKILNEGFNGDTNIIEVPINVLKT